MSSSVVPEIDLYPLRICEYLFSWHESCQRKLECLKFFHSMVYKCTDESLAMVLTVSNFVDVVDAPSGVEVKADPDGPPPLPEGWATAKDSQGRIYYWHKKTQEVQWEKPKD